jgi:hypothetical protein
LASCSLAGVPERSYAQARAMIHIILLGDSVFDNAAYVSRDPDVLRQLEQMLPQGRKATLLARDGAVIGEIGNQLRGLPCDATHLVISVGGNDALRESGVLESSALSVADAPNPIEPSARGGAKIAQAISKFAGGATPRSSVFTDQ